MRTMLAAALAAATLPIAASAQVIYYGPSISNPPATVYSTACTDRDARLLDRGNWLDNRKRDIDRDGAALADELRRLDNRDIGAVASYNARSAEHNRRVAELNAGVAQYNADMQALVGDCNYTYVVPRRGDVIIWERSSR
jgi:hypothetical protein